jgi:hypothetical protein
VSSAWLGSTGQRGQLGAAAGEAGHQRRQPGQRGRGAKGEPPGIHVRFRRSVAQGRGDRLAQRLGVDGVALIVAAPQKELQLWLAELAQTSEVPQPAVLEQVRLTADRAADHRAQHLLPVVQPRVPLRELLQLDLELRGGQQPGDQSWRRYGMTIHHAVVAGRAGRADRECLVHDGLRSRGQHPQQPAAEPVDLIGQIEVRPHQPRMLPARIRKQAGRGKWVQALIGRTHSRRW